MKASLLIMMTVVFTSNYPEESEIVHHFEGSQYERLDTLFVGQCLLHLTLANEEQSDKIFYSINNTPSIAYRQPISFHEQGFYSLVYFLNNGSDAKKKELTFFVDNTPPQTSALIEFKGIRLQQFNIDRSEKSFVIPRYSQITIRSNDGGVGIDHINYQVDEAPEQIYSEPIRMTSQGKHVIKIRAFDLLGNISSSSVNVTTE